MFLINKIIIKILIRLKLYLKENLDKNKTILIKLGIDILGKLNEGFEMNNGTGVMTLCIFNDGILIYLFKIHKL